MRAIYRGTLAASALLLPLTIAGTAATADRPAGMQDDQWILKEVGLAAAAPLGTAEMSRTRGAGFFSALLAALPSENTVQVTINDQPTETQSGPGTQTLGGTVNGSTFNAIASNPPTASPPSPAPVIFTHTSVRTATRTRSSSFSIGW